MLIKLDWYADLRNLLVDYQVVLCIHVDTLFPETGDRVCVEGFFLSCITCLKKKARIKFNLWETKMSLIVIFQCMFYCFLGNMWIYQLLVSSFSHNILLKQFTFIANLKYQLMKTEKWLISFSVLQICMLKTGQG